MKVSTTSCASERNSLSAFSERSFAHPRTLPLPLRCAQPWISEAADPLLLVLLVSTTTFGLGSGRPAQALSQHLPHGVEEGLRGERLVEVGVRAQLDAPLAIGGTAVGGDEDERGAGMPLAVAHMAHELEPVDLRHVDVGDDEVVLPAR